MLKTERLYYADSYLKRAQSQVIAASEDGLRIILDRTHFYPTSGGQPHDLGMLNGISVNDVVDDGDTVTHVMSAALHAATVAGEILWDRRYDHMQQHTGQHLLSAVFEELFQISTLSFRMGDQNSTIELGTRELTLQQIEAATLKATELARANPPVVLHFEDAAEARGLRKESQRTGLLRIVEIPGTDRSACGGTHVATLAEVLPLQIRDQDKVRGNIRIAFVCGNRAVRHAQLDCDALSRLAGVLAAPREDLEATALALKQTLAEVEKDRQRLEREAAVRAGVDLYSNISPNPAGVRRAVVAEAVIDENARAKAKAFTSQPKAVVLMHSAEGLLLACSADSGLHSGAILKQALSKYGARGGGSQLLAQGSLPDEAILRDLSEALGA